MLTLQREVARAIASELRVTLTRQEQARLAARRPTAPEAYDYYLMGDYYLGKMTKSGYRRAIGYFRKAIAVDSTYASAWGGLAMAYSQSLREDPARSAVRKALELDSTQAEAHIALGDIELTFDWDWVEAEKAYRRGIELKPTASQAHVAYTRALVLIGRYEEALAVDRKSVERDPLSPRANLSLGWTLLHLGRHAESRKYLEKAAELAPGLIDPPLELAQSYVETGEFDEALRYAARADTLIGEEESAPYLIRLSYVYAKSGRRARAREILRNLEIEGRAPPALLALGYLGLGQEENALELLEEAYRRHDDLLPYVKGYYMFNPLRDDPRFQELVDRVDAPDV